MLLKCSHVLLALCSAALRHFLILVFHVNSLWEDLYLCAVISENPAVGPGQCATIISEVRPSCFRL